MLHVDLDLSPAAISLAVNITTLLLVSLLAIPALIAIVKSARRRNPTGEQYAANFYQDKDGEATKESIAQVSKKTYAIFNVIFVVLGCSTALTRAVLIVVYKQPFLIETWLQFGLWLFLVVQSTAVLTKNHYTARFFLGLMKGLSCLISIIALAFETFNRWYFGRWDDVQVYLISLQVGLAAAAMLLSFSFQRRPDVFRNGTVVDQEYTTSVLGRLTFSWAAPLVGVATRSNFIEVEQLAELDLETRAKSQHDTFTWIEEKMNMFKSDKTVGVPQLPGKGFNLPGLSSLPGLSALDQSFTLPGMGKPPLWRILLLSNVPQITTQVLVSVPQCLLTFAPHLCLLQILRLLELRAEEAAVFLRVLPWVAGLGLSIGLSSLFENWNFWIAQNKISLRVYEQLSAVAYGKAMRLDGSLNRDTSKEKNKDKAPFRTQNAINLVAVDVSRIVQAAGLLYNVLVAPAKLALAFVILQRLLGWKSMLAGVAALSALAPVHHKFMEKSKEADAKLRARREEKTAALTEALQGVRHIKFAALEGRWESKLNQLRNLELLAQGIASGWKVASFSLWIFTPISASLAALPVYATYNGELPPSVAFTAIATLTTLESSVSAVPDLLTQVLDAWTSLGHVSKFLDAPEKVSKTTPSDIVAFEKATIAWPGTVESKASSSTEDDDSSATLSQEAHSDTESGDSFGRGNGPPPKISSAIRAVKAPIRAAKATVRGVKATVLGVKRRVIATIKGIKRQAIRTVNGIKTRVLKRGLSIASGPISAFNHQASVPQAEDAPSQPQADDSSSEEETPYKPPFTLGGLNAEFPKNGLSIVHGPTGSGKSLLLAAILGESEIVTGKVKTPALSDEEDIYSAASAANEWILDSAMAYVAQSPLIEASTIKENIVFGLPFIEGRYEKVLAACALTRDFETLQDKDLTELGPNGVNLSSGQKMRISLARALYSRAGVLILDDIFGAVDVHTARHLYKHALTGDLATGRTRILATNHVKLCLPRLDYLVYLNKGLMRSAGYVDHALLDELIGRECDVAQTESVKNNVSFTRSMFNFVNKQVHDRVVDPLVERAIERANEMDPMIGRIATAATDALGRASPSAAAAVSSAVATTRPSLANGKPANFVEAEVGSSSVTWGAFRRYIRECGGWYLWLPVAVAFPAYIGIILGENWVIKLWSSQPHSPSGLSREMQIYLGIYGSLSTAAVIAGTVGCFFALTASMQASRRLFHQTMPIVFRTPLRWLDTVPLGRILSRLSADLSVIDSRLGMDLTFMACYAMQVVGVLVAGVAASPLSLVGVFFLVSTCTPYARWYLSASRALKRVESVTRIPVYELFDSSSMGLSTIRTYRRTDVYMDKMHENIDRHARACWHLCLVNRWLTFRLNAGAALFAVISALIAVMQPYISAPLAGFALCLTLQLSTAMTMGVKSYANFEQDVNSVERVLEYAKVGTENYENGEDAPEAWPTEGKLEVSDLAVQYAPGQPAALSGVTFQAERNERIGIVGRSGAGKSTLALSLFRFLEAMEGHIWVDGMDISQIRLSELRSRMAIIPQNPTLFAGTVRSNLDPFGEHKDEVLLNALKRVQWIPNDKKDEDPEAERNGIEGIVNDITATANQMSAAADDMVNTFNTFLGREQKRTPSALDTLIADGGQNISQGQRQLLCLARAMVSPAKILVLDEATSSMDNMTDAKIRNALHSTKSTMLVIAHRLRTVADFDRILVLDGGKMVEFGRPRDLMQISDGVFRGMVEEDLEREELKERINLPIVRA
ncbi:hypothetical protein ASPWEDRAFT_161533 [Aspergillus wentii DTO 134E9]|uniref:ABC transporter domain-containing protein n=1 Tax=Aspergillus wentii DTO 134E9 TaxID=1073089 RepID=A0A1L9RBE1_ASPWE|nr:uncharacterized protein ASPWEDRAFT_161533 [Aspergillus wentii DTO 134E9]KAI9934749.1 hypothetical protein MW887_000366 [Aspergillus wentii]OJJ32177.1 hypothetical protein ASPWEDRAFT_161533 [Aspergillus wentii DTO 134E9]